MVGRDVAPIVVLRRPAVVLQPLWWAADSGCGRAPTAGDRATPIMSNQANAARAPTGAQLTKGSAMKQNQATRGKPRAMGKPRAVGERRSPFIPK
jgi:hypothetical protein